MMTDLSNPTTRGSFSNETYTTKDGLRAAFNLPQDSTTLKLKLKEGTVLEMAALLAYRYVMDNTDGITRVEFRYGARGYIVVAKLSDDKLDKETETK